MRQVGKELTAYIVWLRVGSRSTWVEDPCPCVRKSLCVIGIAIYTSKCARIGEVVSRPPAEQSLTFQKDAVWHHSLRPPAKMRRSTACRAPKYEKPVRQVQRPSEDTFYRFTPKLEDGRYHPISLRNPSVPSFFTGPVRRFSPHSGFFASLFDAEILGSLRPAGFPGPASPRRMILASRPWWATMPTKATPRQLSGAW